MKRILFLLICLILGLTLCSCENDKKMEKKLAKCRSEIQKLEMDREAWRKDAKEAQAALTQKRVELNQVLTDFHRMKEQAEEEGKDRQTLIREKSALTAVLKKYKHKYGELGG